MPTNEDRANWADSAICAFALDVGQDPEFEIEEIIGDLLADLMHYCNQKGLNFDELLSRGRDHYECEMAEEAEEVQ